MAKRRKVRKGPRPPRQPRQQSSSPGNMQQQILVQTSDNKLRGLRNRRAFVSLQGSLLSLLFALLGAYLWCPAVFR